MTDAKFCDIHVNPNNVVPKDRTMRVTLTKYNTQIKRNTMLFLDGCNPCIQSKILDTAKSFGLDIEHGWKVEVLIRPKTKHNKSAKWRKTFMGIEEFMEYQKELEQESYEEEEPSTPRMPANPPKAK